MPPAPASAALSLANRARASSAVNATWHTIGSSGRTTIRSSAFRWTSAFLVNATNTRGPRRNATPGRSYRTHRRTRRRGEDLTEHRLQPGVTSATGTAPSVDSEVGRGSVTCAGLIGAEPAIDVTGDGHHVSTSASASASRGGSSWSSTHSAQSNSHAESNVGGHSHGSSSDSSVVGGSEPCGNGPPASPMTGQQPRRPIRRRR